ncbi:MAG: SpoIIE family protein phosphatase [Planctomycetes bacterium]|nr:SpoIIE family protein phosphatase [Planctomycetota bacterium]
MEPKDLSALDGLFSNFDAAWVYAGQSVERAAVYRTLGVLGPWHLPTMLSRVGDTRAPHTCITEGVLAAPPEAPVNVLLSMLQSLMCCGQMITPLKHELAITQRHHQGLRGQIDKLDEELRMASRLQRQFLPQTLPKLDGIAFDVLFRPAGYVSGDIYDVTQIDDHHLGFYVADAVGHGVPAALLTMYIKNSLARRDFERRGQGMQTPDAALARLNRELLLRQSTTVQFCTACYGIFNTTTRRLQLARAGHPAPLLLTHDGRVEPLEPQGPLLGVFEDESFDLLERDLAPGDRLLIYSDGFEVAFGTGEKAVDDRYMDELQMLRHGTLSEALAALEQKLDVQSGSLHQRDDLTALMMDIAA